MNRNPRADGNPGWLLFLALATTAAMACGGVVASGSPEAGASAAANASQSPASASGSATARPEPTLPGGLELRGGRPALVDGEAAACIPLCGEGRAEGGMLPAGRYQSEWFFGGYLTLETDGTWPRGEDSNGELGLRLPTPDGLTYQMAFFLDPSLVVEDVVQDVSLDASSFVAWLADQPHLVVSEPILTHIGSIPASAVDIRLAPGAPSQYNDCRPDPCVSFITVAASDHSDGVLGDDEYRFYFADITYAGTDHILAVKVEGQNPAHLDAALAKVEPILATVAIPAKPAPHPLVGEWLGLHTCTRIMDVMTGAGMRAQGLLNAAESGSIPGVTTTDQIADPKHPCVGEVEVPHSHFFTAGGAFGSRDANGQQVDDGQWQLIDFDTFSINGTPFGFRVDGDELRMAAVDVGTCPDPKAWCPEAWKLMVAMPGMVWTRSPEQ